MLSASKIVKRGWEVNICDKHAPIITTGYKFLQSGPFLSKK